MTVSPGDAARVRELLGREPQGAYEIVVRDDAGDPVVLRNAPLLDDGTPMPTRYWLVSPDEIRRVGRLESAGGVDRAEAEVDPDELAAAHDRYAAERDADLPTDHDGPRPSGGVGGTRTGVKCLHAHWAWHLAGGDDPVGRWIARQLDALRCEIGDDHLRVRWHAVDQSLPVGVVALYERWLADDDPPRPASLTNAIGDVTDHLDDIVREHPAVADRREAVIEGRIMWSVARLETGLDRPATPFTLDRPTAEEIFRLVATERRADRAHNPGLPSSDVEHIVAALCIVVAVMRKLGLAHVTLPGPGTA